MHDKIATKEIKGARSLNPNRRSRDEVQNVLNWVQYILAGEEGQITIRHLFYRLVGHGVIEKTEGQYKALGKLLSKWRRSGAIKWSAFADNTRWHIQPMTFDSMDDALSNTVANYRRNLWQTQDVYLECWCEKDAVASILSKAADPFGVPIFVSRGFASLSSLHASAETFRASADAGKRPIIYHFGDYDPSGVEAGESMVRSFRDDFKVEVDFIRAAVTREQIKKLKLPTRPTKESNHSKSWTGGDSVELDSMPPAALRKLVETSITQHIDQRKWDMLKMAEKFERNSLMNFKENFIREQ